MIKTNLIVLFASLLIWSCKDSNTPTSIVFKYNQPNPITSLDPAFAKSQNNIWATNHLFDGLVRLDDSLNVIPSIAKTWHTNDDATEVTFILRDDIYFHTDQCFGNQKTRRVVASDVEYSLSRLLDDAVNSPGSWLFADKKGEKPLFTAINDTIFQINLKRPFMPLLGILTMQYCSVVPREAVESYGDNFRSNPVGTGPFALKRWVEDQALFLKRNEAYFGSNSGNVEYIKTSFITDKQIALFELLNGNLDLISGLESSFANDLLDREGELQNNRKDIIKYEKTPYLNTEYLGINMLKAKDHPYLSQRGFRQALNYAIDKQLMMRSLRNGVGIPGNAGFIPAGLPSHNPSKVQGYNYNQDKARRLLKQCDYDGSPIEIYTNNEYLDICTYVAKQWENIGINVKIEVMESAILRDGMRKSGISIFRASWIADYPDGESFLCMFYSKNPPPPNYTRFNNPEFDILYEKALGTSDITTRINLYQQMDRIIIEEAPVIFLFYDESSIFYNNRIDSYRNNGLNIIQTNFVIDTIQK